MQAKFLNYRCCQVLQEAGAWRCDSCGIAYPTSELRALILGPAAIAVYIVAVLAFITFRFWQDF
jgi:hypothetical protein